MPSSKFLPQLGVVNWLNDIRSMAIQREMVPVVQYVLLDSVKTLFGGRQQACLAALAVQ
jgi:hypothetical protein